MAELLAHGAHGDEDVEVVDERGELIEVVVVDDELLESLEIASFLLGHDARVSLNGRRNDQLSNAKRS